jgi:hypothetical protein
MKAIVHIKWTIHTPLPNARNKAHQMRSVPQHDCTEHIDTTTPCVYVVQARVFGQLAWTHHNTNITKCTLT